MKSYYPKSWSAQARAMADYQVAAINTGSAQLNSQLISSPIPIVLLLFVIVPPRDLEDFAEPVRLILLRRKFRIGNKF